MHSLLVCSLIIVSAQPTPSLQTSQMLQSCRSYAALLCSCMRHESLHILAEADTASCCEDQQPFISVPLTMQSRDIQQEVRPCCRCYPTKLLGTSPHWYRSRSYRARVVSWPSQIKFVTKFFAAMYLSYLHARGPPVPLYQTLTSRLLA